ncbi:MAG TPA: ribonuclease D [Candidatus Binatia bacterium]|nr:ribonuclease D [Candidatus Binatia bacterium]
MPAPLLWIDTPAALDAQLRVWETRPWLALDTEFVREDTYFPVLCLVQVGDGETAALVDVRALDPAPLFALLARPQLLKIFHAAGQDLEIFVQHSGDCPRPLFDTQLAAALLGHGEQLGYAALVQSQLQVQLDKSLARTDWSRRPLPQNALEYAADDVRHLATIFPMFRDALAAKGRLGWLEEECRRQTDPVRYRPDPASAWHTVKGLSRLPAPAQHRAARLARWREEQAVQRNRPRRWILDDAAVCRLAEQPPQTREQLAATEGVFPKLVARAGDELLALLAEPVPDAPPLYDEERLTGEQKRRIQTLQERVRALGAQHQVSPTLIATRGDLETLVREGERADLPLLRGWRRELAGEELLRTSAAG